MTHSITDSLLSSNALIIAGTMAAAYLLASINFAILACRLLHRVDPRTNGSGNPGATNLLRTWGPGPATIVLLLDVGRAFGLMFAAWTIPACALWPVVALPILTGNVFPVFHGFKGGKGVATSCGILLALSPVSVGAGAIVFLLVFGITRRVSPASLALALTTAVTMYVVDAPLLYTLTAASIFPILLATHRHNIARLLRGEEPRISIGAPTGKE